MTTRIALSILACLLGAAGAALSFYSDHDPVSGIFAAVLAFAAVIVAIRAWTGRTTDKNGIRTWRS